MRNALGAACALRTHVPRVSRSAGRRIPPPPSHLTLSSVVAESAQVLGVPTEIERSQGGQRARASGPGGRPWQGRQPDCWTCNQVRDGLSAPPSPARTRTRLCRARNG